ncbi:MAG TPA: DUF6455 family protein [Burkholderiales bacterium]|nr:DUF6455 family protein [Burkholderiales bacterium]
MSLTLESVVTVALGGLVFLVAAYYVLETWLRAWEQQLPSPLVRTLHRVGADPERLARPGARHLIALAERSCPACAATGACREWLESGSPTAYRSFCPNAALVEHLTR